MKNSEYDVVIIGAGPAGCVAARFVAMAGYSVLLLEKRPVVGAPVRCGEATGSRWRLAEYGPLPEESIETDINGVILYGPHNIRINYRKPQIGLMLDRLKFDPWYAALAMEAGAELVLSARACDIRPVQNNRREVVVELEGEKRVVQARMVIGADGVEALSGRWTGLETRQLPPHTCSAIELKLDLLIPEKDSLVFWHGHDHINNGYIWAFPKVKSGITNFGAGFLFPKLGTPSIKEVATKWLEKLYPGAKVLDVMGGTDPVSGTLRQTVADNFLLAGDAAHHTNPMTGGGIAAAMRAGKIAAQVVDAGLKIGNLSESFLQAYHRRCWDAFGRNHQRELGIRRFLLGLNRPDQIEFYRILQTWVEKGKQGAILRHPLSMAKLGYRFWRSS